MKVLMLMASSGNGGLERHFVELVTGLSAMVDVVAVAPEAMLDRLPGGVGRFPIPDKVSRYSLRLRWQLAQLIRRERPEVVHAQANKSAAIARHLKSRFPEIRFVATIHNRKNSIGMYRGFDRVIGVSRTVADQLPDQGPVRVVFNGLVPASSQASVNGWLPQQPPRLLAVGRLVDAKGFDLLIAAMRGIDATLRIAGDGPDRVLLQQQIAALDLGDRIELLGERHDIPALMAESDAVIISSRREGFSYVLCEALQAGLPVLATRVPVACEILPKAWLIDAGDEHALHDGIVRFIGALPGMDAERRRMTEFARTALTVDAMVANTLGVYRET